jgi:putative mRNA 3-end processing factor
MSELVQLRAEGLYCPAGDFYIDPERPVARAVITHAHGDHARTGSGRYWGAASSLGLLRERLGRGASIEAPRYGETFRLGGVDVSLHPAGHILGSAQVRIASHSLLGPSEVWVVSGDYKRDDDPSCEPFEALPCDCFVTESTFAKPHFVWPDPAQVATEIFDWWRSCRDEGRCAVLFCYALGKTQRILALLQRLRADIDAAGLDATVLLHPTMTALVKLYRSAGVAMLPTESLAAPSKDADFKGRLILAPPGAGGTPWMKRFAPYSTAFASGWMGEQGDAARMAKYGRGFTLSDHADWPSLLRTIRETGARRVRTMHGDSSTLIELLRREGIDARELGG